MNSDSPQFSRDLLEARLTALLLGELTPAEEAEVRQAVARDPELSRLHDQIKATIPLLREAMATAAAPSSEDAAPRLSEDRRQKILGWFKVIAPAELAAPKWHLPRWLIPAAAAVMLIAVLAGMLLPATARSKARASRVMERYMGARELSRGKEPERDAGLASVELAREADASRHPDAATATAGRRTRLDLEADVGTPGQAARKPSPARPGEPATASGEALTAHAPAKGTIFLPAVQESETLGFVGQPVSRVLAQAAPTDEGGALTAGASPLANAWTDFDNDGNPDLFVSSSETRGSQISAGDTSLFFNKGYGGFAPSGGQAFTTPRVYTAGGGVGGGGGGGGVGNQVGFAFAESSPGSPSLFSSHGALEAKAAGDREQFGSAVISPQAVEAPQSVNGRWDLADKDITTLAQRRSEPGVHAGPAAMAPPPRTPAPETPDLKLAGITPETAKQALVVVPPTSGPAAEPAAVREFLADASSPSVQIEAKPEVAAAVPAAPLAMAGPATLAVMPPPAEVVAPQEMEALHVKLPSPAFVGTPTSVPTVAAAAEPAKTPVLGDLPVLGRTFRSEPLGEVADKSEGSQLGKPLAVARYGGRPAVVARTNAMATGLGVEGKEGTMMRRYGLIAPTEAKMPAAEEGRDLLRREARGEEVAQLNDKLDTVSAGVSAIPATPADQNRFVTRYPFALQPTPAGQLAEIRGTDLAAKEKAVELQTQLAESKHNIALMPSPLSTSAAPLAQVEEEVVSRQVPPPEPAQVQQPAAVAGPSDSKQKELLVAKRELENQEKIRDAMKLRIGQETTDTSVPKSSVVEIVDRAEAQPGQRPSLWKRIGTGLTGEVERSARIAVEKQVSDVNPLGFTRAATQYDPYFLETESQRIKSRKVLDGVIDKLKLDEAWGEKAGGRGRLSRDETYALLEKRLTLKPVPNSSLLDVQVKSDEPEEAARIANTVAEAYREERLARQKEQSSRGAQQLNRLLAEQDKQLAEAREKVAELERELRPKQEDLPAPRPATDAPIPQPEVQTATNPFSTFSLNVSDVSFKLASSSLENGTLPDPAGIRSEEFINAFDYHDPEPLPGMPLAFAWEHARTPFAHNRDLLRLSLQTAARGREPGRPLNLVLLLDNSGSMERADRVAIIREALRVLTTQLQPQDKISVVAFARTARLWIDGLSGAQAGELVEKVGNLAPQGGTNLEDALRLAYETAIRHYLPNGVNRVVLLTDGAANLGDVDPDSLKAKVESNRKQGIALDCFGIGWEGYNDDLLEVLSRNGDGRYGFVNTPEEAAAGFANQLAGGLQVAAADVKVQVEFNPQRVTAWRQIGYAKHQLTKEQFRDNTVDAAELGAAESGNALYTVEMNPLGEGPLGMVRARFKVPTTGEYREFEWDLPYLGEAPALDQASVSMRLAGVAAAFSEWLASSPFATEVTPDELLKLMAGVPEVFGADARPTKLECMIRQAKSLAGR